MKHIEVAAAVFIQHNKVFAAQRKNEGELALYWEFPGGKLEHGESGEEAAIREIKEELSAEIAVVKYLTTVVHQYTTFKITLIAYLCEVTSGNLTISEHIASRWLAKEELHTVEWAAADLPIVALVEKMLR
ncbi:MAG: (deoxy)nucleoside triphosphate pyrophosphohydrolase [Sphaerochaetaceae bacterium]|jgi:8-oxo-dGTP diphosphatase|nr:(deoxy)nucleoside triphosphate pyrophosphohydrolase [Sphaerochaetaceae bacterium]